MAFTGIGKLIKDLVTGTPADTDYFAFGNTDLKKVSFPNLKKALGIDALNSALALKHAVDNIEGAEFGYNFLMLGIGNKNSVLNKTSYFSIEPNNESKWNNKPSQMPTGIVVGVREVFYRNDSHVLVRITEFYPVCGRQYFNFYNVKTWSGWKLVTPS